jgi:hypothetical protein
VRVSRDTSSTAKYKGLTRLTIVGGNGAEINVLLDNQELDDLATALTFYRQGLDVA